MGGLVFGVVEIFIAFVLDSIESKLEGEVSGIFISSGELVVGLSDSILSLPPELLSWTVCRPISPFRAEVRDDPQSSSPPRPANEL